MGHTHRVLKINEIKIGDRVHVQRGDRSLGTGEVVFHERGRVAVRGTEWGDMEFERGFEGCACGVGDRWTWLEEP